MRRSSPTPPLTPRRHWRLFGLDRTEACLVAAMGGLFLVPTAGLELWEGHAGRAVCAAEVSARRLAVHGCAGPADVVPPSPVLVP